MAITMERAAKLVHADFEFPHGPDITGIGLDSATC
jgi:hypothetical protein